MSCTERVCHIPLTCRILKDEEPVGVGSPSMKPLHQAALMGQPRQIELLLNAGADINARSEVRLELVSPHNHGRRTVLRFRDKLDHLPARPALICRHVARLSMLQQGRGSSRASSYSCSGGHASTWLCRREDDSSTTACLAAASSRQSASVIHTDPLVRAVARDREGGDDAPGVCGGERPSRLRPCSSRRGSQHRASQRGADATAHTALTSPRGVV